MEKGIKNFRITEILIMEKGINNFRITKRTTALDFRQFYTTVLVESVFDSFSCRKTMRIPNSEHEAKFVNFATNLGLRDKQTFFYLNIALVQNVANFSCLRPLDPHHH